MMTRTNYPREALDDLIDCARHMRNHPTNAEAFLWDRVRSKRLCGIKFRRQHIIPPFIVDFYCSSRKLIIEIDGSSHEHKRRYDREREQFLRELGYSILRLTNEDILERIDQSIEKIKLSLLSG